MSDRIAANSRPEQPSDAPEPVVLQGVVPSVEPLEATTAPALPAAPNELQHELGSERRRNLFASLTAVSVAAILQFASTPVAFGTPRFLTLACFAGSLTVNGFMAFIEQRKLDRPSKLTNPFVIKAYEYSLGLGPILVWMAFVSLLAEVNAVLGYIFLGVTLLYFGLALCWQDSEQLSQSEER